jgi:hypothetical protein
MVVPGSTTLTTVPRYTVVGGATGTPTTPGTVVVVTDTIGSVDVVTVGTTVVIVPVDAFGNFPDTNSAMQSTPGK